LLVGFAVPHLVLVLAVNPRLKQLLIAVVLRHLHALFRRIVLCQVDRIQLFIVCRLHALHFFGRKAAVPDTLDTSVELSMDTSASNANKASHGEIYTAGKHGIAIGAALVGSEPLKLSNSVVGRNLRLATSGMRRSTN